MQNGDTTTMFDGLSCARQSPAGNVECNLQKLTPT